MNVRCKMRNAYAIREYVDAKRALDRLLRELMDLNPSAARSLEEGLEETLSVHRLGVPTSLRKTLSSTNLIESAFSVVETVCQNVKRWRGEISICAGFPADCLSLAGTGRTVIGKCPSWSKSWNWRLSRNLPVRHASVA